MLFCSVFLACVFVFVACVFNHHPPPQTHAHTNTHTNTHTDTASAARATLPARRGRPASWTSLPTFGTSPTARLFLQTRPVATSTLQRAVPQLGSRAAPTACSGLRGPRVPRVTSCCSTKVILGFGFHGNNEPQNSCIIQRHAPGEYNATLCRGETIINASAALPVQ